MKLIQSKSFSHSIIWVIFLFTAVPIGILALYNHPSVADDYCFAYMTRDYGFWEGQKLYYEGWSGRYISNMLFHATPLAFGYFGFVKVMPFLILALLFHSLYVLLGELIPTSRQNRLLLTLVFLSLYISQSASVLDNFFWYTSVFIFPISICYWLYLMAVLIRYYQPQYKHLQWGIGSLCATLVFFIVGSNELMMLFIVGLLTSIWGYWLIFEKRIDKLLTILLIIGAFCAYFLVIKAPGNQIRMQGSVLGGNIVESLTDALKSVIKDGIKWTFLSPLIPLSILFIAWYQKFVPPSKSYLFRANPIITLLVLFGLLLVMFFSIHYGNRDGVPDRVKNAIFAFFLFGWFYHLLALMTQFPRFFAWPLNSQLIGFGLILWSIFFWYKSNNIQTMYTDIVSGTAKGYSQEMDARYQLIQATKRDTVYVQPLKNSPKSLYFDEIKDSPDHLWNKCYATYFNKKTIILKNK